MAAVLIFPGLGTLDFCLAQQQFCHEAEATSCCCPGEESDREEAPCCVAMHQDWMAPVKGESPKLELPELSGFEPDFVARFSMKPVQSETHERVASPDPPPRRLAAWLALIQVRLI